MLDYNELLAETFTLVVKGGWSETIATTGSYLMLVVYTIIFFLESIIPVRACFNKKRFIECIPRAWCRQANYIPNMAIQGRIQDFRRGGANGEVSGSLINLIVYFKGYAGQISLAEDSLLPMLSWVLGMRQGEDIWVVRGRVREGDVPLPREARKLLLFYAIKSES